MTFEERVDRLISHKLSNELRDFDDPQVLTPCLVKSLLWEVIHYARDDGNQAMLEALLEVWTTKSLPVDPIARAHINASVSIRTLVTFYVTHVQCTRSFTDAVVDGTRELLLRGGVQAVSRDFIARRVLSIMVQAPVRW